MSPDTETPSDRLTTRLENDFQALKNKITELGDKIEKLGDAADDSLESSMVALADKEQRIYSKMKGLASATGEDLEKLHTDIQTAIDDMEQNYRQTYSVYVESELKDMSAKIEQLRKKAGKAAEEQKEEINSALHELAMKERQLLEKAKNLKDAAADEWEDIRKKTEKSIEELVSFYAETSTNI